MQNLLTRTDPARKRKRQQSQPPNGNARHDASEHAQSERSHQPRRGHATSVFGAFWCGPLNEAVRRDALLRKELLDGRVVAGVADRGHPLGLHVLEALVGARPLRIEGGAALRDRTEG